MPNKPATSISSFRIPPDVKTAAAERAASEGRTLTDVIVDLLCAYVTAPPPPRPE